MLFNSFDFAVYLPIVFLLYWFVFNKNVKARNFYLLVVSYVFYGFWDWRFLSLIFISSIVDYYMALMIDKMPETESKKRKNLLIVSLVTNLAFLGFFKYYNFFVDSFVDTFALFGKEFNYSPLNIILPVGISFYTFQSLSYTIDVYYKKMKPTKDPISFLAFVSFFPQLVAGPIERAVHLLPQFDTLKTFDYQRARSGALMIVFGLFKKVVIADRIGTYVNQTYGDISNATGLAMFWGVIFFAFQLYLDFSAYSEIAIGSARIFGFDLSVNFSRPYLATSFSNFWKRWHITLSSWFQDYIYIPLGGNRKGANRTMINLMIVFLLSGLWHGASWNFVIWGAINGFFLIVLDRIFSFDNKSTGFKRYLASFIVFMGWTLSLIFFRAQTFHDAMLVFQNIGLSNSENIYNYGLNKSEFKFSIFLLIALMFYEIWVEKKGASLLEKFYQKNMIIRWSVYLGLVIGILLLGAYGSSNDNSFIYFQF